MNILFAGNQVQDFLYHGQAFEQTAAGTYDPNWVPNCIEHNDNDVGLRCPVFADQTDVWIHWNDRQSGTYTDWPMWYAYNGAGTAKLRLRDSTTGARTFVLEWHNGSTWVSLGSVTDAFSLNTLTQHDVHVKIDGASSELAWYINKVQVVKAIGDFSSIVGIAQANWLAARNNTHTTRISEVIIADESTISLRYKLILPETNGTHNDFTGDVADVDEVQLNNNDFIYATTANLLETFKAAARDFSGFTIKTVSISIYGLRGQDGPQNVQPVFRIGGADYLGTILPLDWGFAPVREYFPLNPATGISWTPTDAGDADLEFGLKSIA